MVRIFWQWTKREGGFLPGNEAEQSADSGQPGIAGSGSATSCVFKMIKEIQHEWLLDVFNTEFLDVFA